MPRILNAVRFGLAAFLLSSVTTTWATEVDNRLPLSAMTVRICGTPAYPPVSWVAPDGRVEGVNAAVVRALLKPLGVQVDDVQNSNWRRCLKEVELGNIDILTGFKTEHRQQFFTYLTSPIIHESIYLYYPTGKPLTKTGWQDLMNLRVGVLMGDSFGDLPDAALSQNPNLERVSTQTQNILKLADQRLDAVPMGKLSGQLQIRAMGLDDRISSVATDVNDYWYVAISNRSPLIQWLPELNDRLQRLLANPATVAGLLERQQTLYLERHHTDAPLGE